jgi:signal peptidase II
VLSIITIFIVFYLALKTKSKLEIIAFFLILGGAFGNLIDRIVQGGVTDFIWVDFPNFIMDRWPVFNIADSSIFIALCLIMIKMLFFTEETEVK